MCGMGELEAFDSDDCEFLVRILDVCRLFRLLPRLPRFYCRASDVEHLGVGWTGGCGVAKCSHVTFSLLHLAFSTYPNSNPCSKNAVSIYCIFMPIIMSMSVIRVSWVLSTISH
jgi:hypothetical protein